MSGGVRSLQRLNSGVKLTPRRSKILFGSRGCHFWTQASRGRIENVVHVGVDGSIANRPVGIDALRFGTPFDQAEVPGESGLRFHTVKRTECNP
jgi:hypothetical protein